MAQPLRPISDVEFIVGGADRRPLLMACPGRWQINGVRVETPKVPLVYPMPVGG